ncbi:uncharacterized protein LOC8064944 [Sorghum bicolor]|uniref:uncharacterized protein LOC8064944 n=1 Tax=Sorghum bicolor TaxID=4558 RepID=UPI000B42454D|nr:uncharacterized protein LOC8064944 [Sorghum bicolor]|eukprot:XP_021321277.1 uncharacterized protein LOC8064944 [Sorghum bicolor]
MASSGVGSEKTGGGSAAGGGGGDKSTVADLLMRLNLTEGEEVIADFSDDEGDENPQPMNWAVVGKVLSPSIVHVNTVRGAMKPAWGNPWGLKIRAFGEKIDNLFVAEFGSKMDMERILAGSPWMVGRHAVILKQYDERLSASEIVFDRMEIWVRILNLPLGWMNLQRGNRAMGLIGNVIKMDVDRDGKASGAFLRARLAIEIDKPLRRGVLLRMSRSEEPKWFAVQYERLPFFCFACGIMGHSEIECPNPVPRNEYGKLPFDVQLRAPEEKRRKVQSFAEAAAASQSSGSSMGSRPPRGKGKSQMDGRSDHSSSETNHVADDTEVQSPLKEPPKSNSKEKGVLPGVNRKLDLMEIQQVRKRKSKPTQASLQTPDLNVPVNNTSAIVPVGLVISRVSQLDGDTESSGGSLEETVKKQKRGGSSNIARSAMAAGSSPRRAQ